MNNNPLISVIIPIYNVEKYLPKCIESVLEQTYTNLEIILVNDGSPDNCGEICDNYAKKDSRIKVIHKENGGLSDARNIGLDIANGEYISFIDSDDFIHSQFIETLINGILQNNSNISFCNYLRFKEEAEIYQTIQTIIPTSNIEKTFTGKQFLNTVYNNVWYPKNVIICNKLYHKLIFKSIQFKKGLIHEDEYIFTDIYSQPNLKVTYYNENLYFYRNTSNSIMNRPISINRIESLKALLKKRNSFFRKENNNKMYWLSINKIAEFYYMALSSGFSSEIKKELTIKRIGEIILNKHMHWKTRVILMYKLLTK